jgi:hypothetical protein
MSFTNQTATIVLPFHYKRSGCGVQSIVRDRRKKSHETLAGQGFIAPARGLPLS